MLTLHAQGKQSALEVGRDTIKRLNLKNRDGEHLPTARTGRRRNALVKFHRASSTVQTQSGCRIGTQRTGQRLCPTFRQAKPHVGWLARPAQSVKMTSVALAELSRLQTKMSWIIRRTYICRQQYSSTWSRANLRKLASKPSPP